MKSQLGRRLRASGVGIFLSVIASQNAYAFTPDPTPLFLGGKVQPNIMLTLDDTGSMGWSFMPDSIGPYSGCVDTTTDGTDYCLNRSKDLWTLSSRFNPLAYDPLRTYTPPLSQLDVPINAPTDYAWDDGYARFLSPTSYDCIVPLGAAGSTITDGAGSTITNPVYRATWGQVARCPSAVVSTGTAEYHAYQHSTGKPYYVVFDASNDVACASTDVADQKSDVCFDVVDWASMTAADQQNFANWYSYYRKRIHWAKAAAVNSLKNFGEGARIGLGLVSETDTGSAAGSTIVEPIGVYTNAVDAHSAAIRSTLLGLEAKSVPSYLRLASDDVGQYFLTNGQSFESDLDPGPWDAMGSESGNFSCRRAFNILISDGEWTVDPDGIADDLAQQGAARDSARRFDIDSTAATLPDGTSYTPREPFMDGSTEEIANTLADVAMYYWRTDLWPGETGSVPESPVDPASWQHLVTIAVGLGANELQSPNVAEAFSAITTPPVAGTITWPVPGTGGTTLADFVHAAVNSRGEFVDMRDPEALVAAFRRVLSVVPGRASSAASVVLNSGALRSDTRLYQARFDSRDWTGQLLAYPINSDGSVGSLLWDAGDSSVGSQPAPAIPSFDDRRIVTFDRGATPSPAGKPFRFDSLSAAQKGTLDTAEVPPSIGPTADDRRRAIINYLRGSTANVPPFRSRSRLLGDIVNSAPAYVGPPATLYTGLIGDDASPESIANSGGTGQSYGAFRSNNASRTPVIYFGANDGMLHAVDADTGAELFAYVPGVLFPKLSKIAVASNFREDDAYVDGSPTVGDVYFNSAWHTMLVAGLGGGGKAVYALDVTDSSVSGETAVAARVKWEFTQVDTLAGNDANGDDRLGYTFGQPSIVRLGPSSTGKWVALFGNGYGNLSQRGRAVLFAVDLATGTLLRSWDTGAGKQQDPLGQSRANGLSTVAAVDYNGDFIADYAYAGDYFGNLWRFSLNDGLITTNNNVTKIFSAVTGSGTPQAITTRPSVMAHPTQAGTLVLFGTGKYIETDDQDDTTRQSFYGIWDDLSSNPSIDRSDLEPREILGEAPGSDGGTYRVTSGGELVWRSQANRDGKLGWYLDLTSGTGERQVSDSVVRQEKVIFTTLTPKPNACDFGGTGWLMELDAATGAPLPYSPFYYRKVDGTYGLVATTSPDPSNPDPDLVTTTPSGRKSSVGIVPTPAILARPGGEREYKYMSGSTGSIEVAIEKTGEESDFGRESWFQYFK